MGNKHHGKRGDRGTPSLTPADRQGAPASHTQNIPLTPRQELLTRLAQRSQAIPAKLLPPRIKAPEVSNPAVPPPTKSPTDQFIDACIEDAEKLPKAEYYGLGKKNYITLLRRSLNSSEMRTVLSDPATLYKPFAQLLIIQLTRYAQASNRPNKYKYNHMLQISDGHITLDPDTTKTVEEFAAQCLKKHGYLLQSPSEKTSFVAKLLSPPMDNRQR